MRYYRSTEARYIEYHTRAIEALSWHPADCLRGAAYKFRANGAAYLPDGVGRRMGRTYYAGLDAPLPEDIAHLSARLITLACYAHLIGAKSEYETRYHLAVYHEILPRDTGGIYGIWCDVLDAYSLIFFGKNSGRPYVLPESIPRLDPRISCARLLLLFARRIMERPDGADPDDECEIDHDLTAKFERLDAAFGDQKKQIDIELMDLLWLILMLWV